MAGRIKYYEIFRKIHLYSAFLVMGFLLMYFITGFFMVHYELFEDEEPVVSTSEHELSIPNNISIENLPVHIQKQFDIHGQRKHARNNDDGSISIQYIRPGHTFSAIVSSDHKSVKITHTQENLHQTLVTFHRLEKYGGGLVYDLYILMMDLSGIALIIFSLSGIYLFLKTIKRKTTGWVFLSCSIAYTLFVIFSLLKT